MALRGFPQGARRSGGYQIDLLQHGLEPEDWKPMKTIGLGVKEIRIRDTAGAFRVIYLAKFEEAVYVLHCFQKKSAKTPQAEIELAKMRFKALRRAR